MQLEQRHQHPRQMTITDKRWSSRRDRHHLVSRGRQMKCKEICKDVSVSHVAVVRYCVIFVDGKCPWLIMDVKSAQSSHITKGIMKFQMCKCLKTRSDQNGVFTTNTLKRIVQKNRIISCPSVELSQKKKVTHIFVASTRDCVVQVRSCNSTRK